MVQGLTGGSTGGISTGVYALPNLDYLVYKVGSTYYAQNNTTGALTSGSVFHTLLNPLLAAYKLVGLRGNTQYDQTDALVMTGKAADRDCPSESIGLIGTGNNTLLNMTGVSKDSIQIKNACAAVIKNLKIIQPAANSGHCIYGMDDGANFSECINEALFENLTLDGCDATHYNLYLKNPFYSALNRIQCRSGTGGNVILDSTAATKRGNSTFKDFYMYCPSGKYCITLQALVNNGALDFCNFIAPQMTTAGGGVKLSCANGGLIFSNHFIQGDFEASEKNILIDAGASGEIDYNTFEGYLYPLDNQTAIDCSAANNNHGGNLFDFHCFPATAAATLKIVNDATTGWKPANIYHFRFGNSFTAANNFTIGAGLPRFSWEGTDGSGSIKNPNWGITSVADGGTLNHRLGATPTHYGCQALVARHIAIPTAVSSTTMTVANKDDAGGALGAENIMWWVAYYP
jgi:hypothetical protein